MDMSFNLKGKKYIVTGASSGIGKGTCKYLSDLGAILYLVARNEDKLQESLSALEGEGHKHYVYDLNDVQGIEKLVKQIVSENGKLDGLIHSAGLGWSRPLKNSKYDFMQDVLRINLFAFMELTRVFSLIKYNNGSGSIVGVSSLASINGDAAMSAYCASKGGMDSFVRAAAKELTGKNIRVNTVQPQWVKTEMMFEYLEEITGNSEKAKDKTMYALEPEEVASVIAFLLSDAASGVNGAAIPLSGRYK